MPETVPPVPTPATKTSTLPSRREDYFCTISLCKLSALDAHRLGHGQDDFIATNCTHERESDTRVTAGRFDDGATLLEDAFLLGIEYHAKSDTVLDTATWVEELHFSYDVSFQVAILYKSAELNQRRLADKFSN